MKNKIVGITGATGFIGSHLMPLLRDSGYMPISFDGNLLLKDDVYSFFKKHKIQTLIHLAGRFAPPFEDLLHINVLATYNLLDIGCNISLNKLIYASSGAVYGEPLNGISHESDPLYPNTFYGLSKKWSEECVLQYANSHLLQYVILRFPNIYGPKNNKGVIFNFLRDIKEKKQITVEGNGEARRNFLHIKDACLAIKKSLEYNNSDIFNISTPISMSINEVIALLKKSYQFTVSYSPTKNNLNNLSLEPSKAKQLLDFETQFNELTIYDEHT